LLVRAPSLRRVAGRAAHVRAGLRDAACLRHCVLAAAVIHITTGIVVRADASLLALPACSSMTTTRKTRTGRAVLAAVLYALCFAAARCSGAAPPFGRTAAACPDVAHRFGAASSLDARSGTFSDAGAAPLAWRMTPTGANGAPPSFSAAQSAFTFNSKQALVSGGGPWGSADGASAVLWVAKSERNAVQRGACMP
jgi:hypothetical protein